MSRSSSTTPSNAAGYDGYHPNRSRVSASALADFIRAPVTGNLREVPGIGEVTAKLLAKDGVDTTHALLGKFLTMKTAGVGTVEHMDRFYLWLLSLGTPAGYRAGICRAIAEKTNTWVPSIYDEGEYCMA